MHLMRVLATIVLAAAATTACGSIFTVEPKPKPTPVINQQAALDYMKSAPKEDTTVLGKAGTRAIVLKSGTPGLTWSMTVLKADGSSATIDASDDSQNSTFETTISPGDYIAYLAEDGVTATPAGVRVLHKAAVPDSSAVTSSPSPSVSQTTHSS
jgi:hypothetical protein